MPWTGDAPPFGFSPADASTPPWLPQPPDWRDYTVIAEQADPASMLQLYRSALRIRHAEPTLGDGPFTWLAAPDGVLAFARGANGEFVCVVNLSGSAVPFPVHGKIVLASGPLETDGLPSDTAVWMRR
jgi:alpha-glucosidase